MHLAEIRTITWCGSRIIKDTKCLTRNHNKIIQRFSIIQCVWKVCAMKIQEKRLNMKRICVSILSAYMLLVISFYFLAGDQLHFRETRGKIEMVAAESGTIELVQGMLVEQSFSVAIQRLEMVSVQWGAYYRVNSGTITMELQNAATGDILMSQSFNAASVQEGTILTMAAEEPIESIYGVPLLLRVYADSQPGSAVTPLMSLSAKTEGQQLYFNGTAVDGTLCFSANGEDYIWTGLHYWKFVAFFGVALIVVLYIIQRRYAAGKHSYIANAMIAMQKYRFLIHQLVSRDFKTKYKRSVLGIFWSFLNPLLTMCVQYFVFSTIFKNDIPNFQVYLLVGIVMFNFFSEACGMSLTSILGNASLITKVYVPKYIYPLTRVMSSVINLIISMIPLIIVAIASGVKFEKSAILSLYFFSCVIIFSLGFGLILSTFMVFFRDTQFLWNVLNMIWMYATPIFYPENIIPNQFKFVHIANPLYHFLLNARICILDGISPEPTAYVLCFFIAIGMLLLGTVVFYKNQDKFILYL